PIGPVLSAPAFYLLLVGSMCSIAAVGGTNQHLKLFLSLDHGYAQGAAAQIASLVLASSLIGRLGAGWLADRFAKKYVMLLIYLLVVSAIPLLLLTGARGTIYLFAVVFGLGLGGGIVVPDPILVGRSEAKLREIARAHGIARVSTDLDSCLANPADAIYFDATLTSARVDHVRRAIAAGKHVYCEKPLAPTTAE